VVGEGKLEKIREFLTSESVGFLHSAVDFSSEELKNVMSSVGVSSVPPIFIGQNKLK